MVGISRTKWKTIHEVYATKDGRIPEIEKEISLWYPRKLEITIKRER